jgi:hypothetical protein
MTQQELADSAGVSLRTVSDLERGAATSPQREPIRLLADALRLIGAERSKFDRVGRGQRRTGRSLCPPGAPGCCSAGDCLARRAAHRQAYTTITRAALGSMHSTVGRRCSSGWNSTGRPRVPISAGAFVSPGLNHCRHGIPSGWSHDAPFAVRRLAHRPRHALVSTRSRGRCHFRTRSRRCPAWTWPGAWLQVLFRERRDSGRVRTDLSRGLRRDATHPQR